MTNVNLGLSTSTVNVNLVGGAPVQVVFEQGEPRQVVLSLANTVLSTGPGGGGGGYPALNMPTGFSVSGSGTALIGVAYSAGYSLPTTAKQSEWDSAFTDRFKWDGSSTGLNAATGRASLGLGGAATLNVGTAVETVAAGDDARFTDARTPTAHKGTHATGGSDALSPADIGAEVAGAASSAVSTHVGQADPHTQYALEANLATVATSGSYADLSNKPSIPAPADAVPQAPGTAAVGTSTEYAREDHVHPLPGVATSSTAGLQPASGYGTVSYAAQVTLDCAALTGQMNTINLTGNLELLTSNVANGQEVRLRLVCDATGRTLTFPTDWKFVGTKPANIAASKVAILSLAAFGTTNADVVAAYAVQS